MVLKPNAVVDIAKPGPQLQNLTGMWNARVLDGFTPFVVQFKENGLPVNLTGLNAFIEGDIGEGHYDSATDDIVMTGTPKSVRYTDDGSGNTNMGIIVFRLPPQFFIQTGIFKGFIGLQSSTGIRSTSNDVWFKVLGNSYTMGISCKYFISDFKKALDQANGKLRDVLIKFNDDNEKFTQSTRDNLDALKGQIQANRDEQDNLTGRLVGVEQQIAIQDIIKRPEFNTKIEQEANARQQEANARQQGDDDLADRLNNLLTATTGKDDSGPEVVDARIASAHLGKKVAKTLGESIRNQIDQVYWIHQVLSSYINQIFASNNDEFTTVSQNSILSRLMRQAGFQLAGTDLLDANGELILDENNNLIDAEEISELTDKTLTLPNVAADAAEVGRQLKNIKSKSEIYGGDFLLSSPMPSPHNFKPEDGTNVGLVVQPSTEASKFDNGQVESPSIIFDESINKYIMVYTAYTKDSQASIGYAYSSDLKEWEPQGQLFHCSGDNEKGDQYGCTGPCLIKYDGLYWLFYLGLNGAGYEGQPINMCLASSSDLKNWDYKGIVIPIQKNISWANLVIYHPCVMRINGIWMIFFNASGYINGQGHERTGFAYSEDIDGPYTVDPNRISEFAEKAGNQSASIECGDPSIFKLNGLYYMFYFDTCHGDEVVDRYGWTTPAEFPRGWRYGGKVINNDQTYNKTYAHKPFVIIKDNTLYHFYTAVGDSGRCIALQTFKLD